MDEFEMVRNRFEATKCIIVMQHAQEQLIKILKTLPKEETKKILVDVSKIQIDFQVGLTLLTHNYK